MNAAQKRVEVPLTLHDVGRYLDSLGNAIAEDMSGAVNRALENEKCLEFTIEGDASLIAELRRDRAVLITALLDMIKYPNPGAVADPMRRHKMQTDQIRAAGNARALLAKYGVDA